MRDGTLFSAVRYGNVLGSRGSVIPFFLKKKECGILPITDPRMTRFWITLEQGVHFVLQCMEKMVGGELFVPKIPSMKIMDLINAVAPECKTEIIGIRPGEKLHEIMITKDDARKTIDVGDFFIIQPDFNFWGRRSNWSESNPVPDNFEYNSGTNPRFLTIDEMKELISGI